MVGGTMTTGASQQQQGIGGGVPLHPRPAHGGMQQQYPQHRQGGPSQQQSQEEEQRHNAIITRPIALRVLAEHGRHVTVVSVAGLQLQLQQLHMEAGEPSGQTVCHPMQADRAVLTISSYQRHLVHIRSFPQSHTHCYYVYSTVNERARDHHSHHPSTNDVSPCGMPRVNDAAAVLHVRLYDNPRCQTGASHANRV